VLLLRSGSELTDTQILTPEEKKRWEEAQKNKDDDCVIM